MTLMKRRRRRLAGLLVLLVVAGCSLGDTSAERLAKDRAKLLGRELTIGKDRDDTALDLVSGVPVDQEVTFLQADGVLRDKNVVIVARISARSSQSGWGPGPSEATLCFRYRLGEWGEGYDRPKVIDCPAGPPLIPPPIPVPPSLPDDAVKRVTAALEGLQSDASVELVRAIVGANFGEPGTTFDVLALEGWTGVAVQVGNDCLLARVRGKTVEAWIPPAVTIQPGELTCTGDTAAQGLAKKNPH